MSHIQGKSLLALAYTFAREDTLTGKHLLLANLCMLKALKEIEGYDVYIYMKTFGKEQYALKMAEKFGFMVVDDDCFQHTFDTYCYIGTGVHKVVVKKNMHYPWMPLEKAIAGFEENQDTTYNFNRYACRWYLKILNYLKDKENVYNIVLDPLFDSTIEEFKPLYFCNYAGNAVFDDTKFSRKFCRIYMQYVNLYYNQFERINPSRNMVYAVFNNATKYSNQRCFALAKAVNKRINIKHKKSDLEYSIDLYNATLRRHWFTVVTYSYDGDTISMLRLMDALALMTVPLIAVEYDDLKSWVNYHFATFCKNNGLLVLEPNFDLERLRNLDDDTKRSYVNNLKTLLEF